ncbi:aldehyde dehydrogenase family protein, partial [Escherichia coli]|nr:aldehyde dehydrogenase family protein [Escherichia coli]
DWAAVPPSQKSRLLHRLGDLVERDAEKLASLEALDMGRPVGFGTMMFVPNFVASLRYYAGWADKINGENIASDGYFGA